MEPLYQLALGAILVIVAAVLEAFCAFGRLARPDMKPGVLKGGFRWVMEALWVLALLAGGVLLLFEEPIFAVTAVVGFWLVLPFLITPIMRNRLLPHWDEVKNELAAKQFNERELYNEKNYWRGDWWMTEEKRSTKKKK